jgi:hypothetical protein
MTTMQSADESLEHAPAAWRRPGVVFVMYAYRLVIALLAAIPFAFLFGSATGGFPRGDALLFDDGAFFLGETMRRSGPALTPIFTGALVLIAVATMASIMPLAALIGALSTNGRLRARDVGAMALRPVGTFALLFGAFALVQAILFAIFSGIAGAISRRPSFTAPTADKSRWAILLLGLLVVCLLGVWHDLARVAVVRDELRFRVALRRGWRTLRTSHVHVIGAWAARASLGLIAIYAALSIGSRLGVDSTAKVVSGFLVYQASIILALFLRASWLASAIRYVDRSRPVVVANPEPELPIAETAAPVEAPVVDAPVAEDVPQEKPASDPTNGEALSALVPEMSPENSAVSDNLDARA